MTIDEIKAKYPRSNPSTEPFAKCPLCAGAGEYAGMLGMTVCGCVVLKGRTQKNKLAILQPLADQLAGLKQREADKLEREQSIAARKAKSKF